MFDEVDGGETLTTATFSEPGRYRLMATGNDVSGAGGGGDQCCWTTAHVDVVVTEASSVARRDARGTGQVARRSREAAVSVRPGICRRQKRRWLQGSVGRSAEP